MRKVIALPFPDTPIIEDCRAFGRFVRAARTQSGMTLADAALAVGVAKQTLQDLETGEASVGLSLALKTAQALGVAVFASPAQDKARNARRLMEGQRDAA